MKTSQFLTGLDFMANREGLMGLLTEMPLAEIGGVMPAPVHEMKFGQMLQLRRDLAEADDLQAVDVIGRVMLDRELLDEDHLCVMPYVLRVLRFVENSIKNEGEKLKYTPTKDEKAAGIERMNQFKEWGIIDTIAQRMHIVHAQVLELPYNDVFLMQWKDLEESKFQRRLMKIQTKSEKH